MVVDNVLMVALKFCFCFCFHRKFFFQMYEYVRVCEKLWEYQA